jgi:two-component system, sensor histidine kinase LadS
MRKYVLTIVAVVCAFCAQAQVILNETTEGRKITQVYHLRTSDSRLDIMGVEHQKFTLLDSTRSRSLGYDKNIHWFRFEVINKSPRPDWFLEVAFSPLDHIEFYSHDQFGKWSLQFSGDLYKFSTRTVKHRNFVFPFTVRPETRETFYLKIVSTSTLQVPLRIWSERGLREHVYEEQFSHGIFYGIMLIMICYNLFLYISIRDRTVLYYVLTLISGANVIAYLHGYGFYYLNPELPELNPVIAAIASPIFIVCSVALARSFLALKQFSFWLDRTLLAVAVVAIIFALLTIGLGDYFSYIPIRLLAILNFLLILISAIYCFLKNYRPARYFLIAWASLLVLGILLLFRNIGWIEGNWFVDNALYFGGIMQTLLISFALGDKINALQKENMLAKERELSRELLEKERLEREVTLRTEEIRQKNSQLEESNNIKDKLFSLISHDLRGPLIALQGVLNLEDMDSLTREDLKKYTEKIGDRLHDTTDFLDNLLQWSKLQMKGEKFVPITQTFLIRDVIDRSTQLPKIEAEKKGIRLMADVAADYKVSADVNMVHTIIRNLVSNAIKFTHPGGKIVITATRKGEFIAVRVSDTGIGISDKHLSTLFTLPGLTMMGTQQEKGTGLGLVVCKEFVERSGGTITVTSNAGVGTTFEFTLPVG